MSYEQARASIESHFKAGWAARTPVAYDGHTMTAAANSVRLTIIDGEGRQATVGSPGANLARYAGVIALQVYTEGGKGTAASRALEDAISDIFRNAAFGEIRCGIPYVSGSIEEPPLLIRTVMVPFTRDTFHA